MMDIKFIDELVKTAKDNQRRLINLAFELGLMTDPVIKASAREVSASTIALEQSAKKCKELLLNG